MELIKIVPWILWNRENIFKRVPLTYRILWTIHFLHIFYEYQREKISKFYFLHIFMYSKNRIKIFREHRIHELSWFFLNPGNVTVKTFNKRMVNMWKKFHMVFTIFPSSYQTPQNFCLTTKWYETPLSIECTVPQITDTTLITTTY